jgi:endonuclease/exonuclease/phosphatase family metal-dependent hydrolase
VSERAERGRGGEKLRIVSWNVHAVPGAPRIPERLRAIARGVVARKPDLVLLQEVWRQRDADSLEETLRRAGYEVVSVAATGVLMRTAGLLGFVRASAGWRTSKPRFHEFQGDGLGDKGVQGFTLSREDFSVEVLNTHLQAAYESGGYAEVRRAQLAELRALTESSKRRPVLLAGDLNTTPDDPAWQEFAGLRDLTARLREACACGTSVYPEESAHWIDHLLAQVPEGWRVEAEVSLLRSQRPDEPYSDHHGLDAIVRITAPARVSLAALAALRLAGPTTRRELLANAALWLLAR